MRRQTELGLWEGMLPLVALVAPYGLWLLEQVLPVPTLWEEGFKVWLVWQLVKRLETKLAFWLLLACGFLFAGSETILYMVNALKVGNFGVLLWRLILTVPMQVSTMVVMWYAFEKKRWWWGLVIAVVIHGGFNLVVGQRF